MRCATLSDLLAYFDLRDRALLLWNANNDFSFGHINWGRLGYVATLTTVSRYMKHVLWKIGINPLVIPNGIPESFLAPPDSKQVEALREAVGGSPFLFKIGRFDPSKRWLMAIDAGRASEAAEAARQAAHARGDGATRRRGHPSRLQPRAGRA